MLKSLSRDFKSIILNSKHKSAKRPQEIEAVKQRLKKFGIKYLKIKTSPTYLPLMLICEGKLLKENLKTAKTDKKFVQNILNKQGGYDIKEVIFLTIDNQGKVVLQIKDKTPSVIQTNYKGGKW